ncbi:MAG: hypothetical protein K2Y18_05195 [Alphaproteobacteria bacterium]|jgi:hypothetical protein|nr:hypothetical protein [Alphaproteobacteria bacterium]
MNISIHKILSNKNLLLLFLAAVSISLSANTMEPEIDPAYLARPTAPLLSDNPDISVEEADDSAFIARISDIIATAPTSLILDSSEINDRRLGILLKMCSDKVLENVVFLNLNNNTIGAEGAKYLAEAFPKFKNLKRLFIKNNKIGSSGAAYLYKALDPLSSSCALRLLELECGSNGIDITNLGLLTGLSSYTDVGSYKQ